MKKGILLIALIGISFGINAQNTFPTDGNVGIGKTSPSEILDIETDYNTNLKLLTTNFSKNPGIIFNGKRENSTKYSTHYIRAVGRSSYHLSIESDEATYFKNNGKTSMYIKGNRDIGIGTTNPQSKLHILGNSSIYSTIENTSGNSKIILGAVTNRNIIYSRKLDNTPQILKFQVNDENDFVINTSGKIGIGTTNPTHKLHVKGASHSGITIESILGKDNFIEFKENTNQIFKVGIDADKNLFKIARTNFNDNSFVVNYNGNVGIGTSNTGLWKLAVNGKIKTKEIKVTLDGWSDFVFEKEYNLASLKEVESHIREKGHLKDIPSAKEVEKNGIYLGEMNSKLLQKIEELTLYTIQQQKEIENIKKENKSLKKVNSKLLELQKRLEKLENK
jgi:hypothetical protein